MSPLSFPSILIPADVGVFFDIIQNKNYAKQSKKIDPLDCLLIVQEEIYLYSRTFW